MKKILGESTSEPFLARQWWFNRFNAQANIKVSGEAARADKKATTDFLETFAAIIKEVKYSAHQVFHVDEMEHLWK